MRASIHSFKVALKFAEAGECASGMIRSETLILTTVHVVTNSFVYENTNE